MPFLRLSSNNMFQNYGVCFKTTNDIYIAQYNIVRKQAVATITD